MMGGYLSRWTMSYFAVSLVWLLIGSGLMASGFGFPSADVSSPDTFVIVHIVGVGWLSTAMCGALLQFAPVLVARPLYSDRLSLPALLLLTAGLVLLLAGFLTLGGRLDLPLALLPAGGAVLSAGFGLVLVNIATTIWRARPLTSPARFVLVGLVSVVVAVALGETFAAALSGWDHPLAAEAVSSGVPLHAIATLGGWLTLTSFGVSYRLLSMFMLSPEIDDRRSSATLLAGMASFAAALGGSAVAILANAGSNALWALSGILSAMTLVLYGRDVIALYRARRRRELELSTRMTVLAFGSLAGAALAALVLAAMDFFAAQVGAVVFLIAFGWLSGLVLAQLYKIVAFLTWLETYGRVMGRVSTPRVQALVVEARAARWFDLYFVSVWLATGLLLVDMAAAFRIAAFGICLAIAGIVYELVRTRRLSEVAEPQRLPQGTTLPRLLWCRV